VGFGGRERAGWKPGALLCLFGGCMGNGDAGAISMLMLSLGG